jgi:hypothetical protein
MENQADKSLLKSFRTFLHRSRGGMISVKRRNYQIHKLETKKILNRILAIKNRHPELSKYLNRIPEFRTNVEDSKIRMADLRKYHAYLVELLEKYELELKKQFGLPDHFGNRLKSVIDVRLRNSRVRLSDQKETTFTEWEFAHT